MYMYFRGGAGGNRGKLNHLMFPRFDKGTSTKSESIFKFTIKCQETLVVGLKSQNMSYFDSS